MLLLLFMFINNAAAKVCSLRSLTIDQPKLVQYAKDSRGLAEPRLIWTEASPEFDWDYPTTYWALPATKLRTVIVEVHYAIAAPTADSTTIEAAWTKTSLTINPVTRTVSGDNGCDVLYSIAQHSLEALHMTRAPATAN